LAHTRHLDSRAISTALRTIVIRVLAVFVVVIASLRAHPALAQSNEVEYVHWAYSAFFGTGWYEIDAGETAFALSYGPRWQLRTAGRDAEGRRQIGIELALQLSGSIHELDLENLPGLVDVENVSALSAVPGIELEIPVNEHWSLKPVAHLGWGTQLGGGDSSWIYWLGLKSRYELPFASRRWALVNSLYYVGYTPETGSSGAITPFMTGIEARQRFGTHTLGGDPLYLRWHIAHTRYADFEYSSDAVQTLGRTQTDIDEDWEIGVALHKADKPLRLWLLKWDQIGLAYRFNSDRSIRALTITFSALFDR
jgi:hypothetical protein